MTTTAKPALVFDLFGTLVHEYGEEQIESLMRGLYTRCVGDPSFAPVGPEIEYGHFKGAMGETYEIYREAARTHGRSPAVADAVKDLLAGFCGEPPAQAVIDRFMDHYADAESLLPIHRADEVLATLADRGYELALLSNVFFPGWIYEQHLQHLGLTDHMKVWLFSSDQPYMKPHDGIFVIMQEQLGRTADGCVMIGDRIDLDILGAQRAGWRTVLIDPKGYGETGGATWVIPDLTDMLELFP